MNPARGEAQVQVGGERVRLCLTLGALAEIESSLEVEGFQALADRLRQLTTADLIEVLAALMRGGGADPATATRMAEASTPQLAAEAVARAFEAATR